MQKIKKLVSLCKKVLRVAVVWLLVELLFVLIDAIAFPDHKQTGARTPAYTVFSFIALIAPIAVAILSSKVNKRENGNAAITTVLPEQIESANVTSAEPTYDEKEPLYEPVERIVEQDIGGNHSSASGSVESELWKIDTMDGHDFEYWTAELLGHFGFTNIEVTRGSGDQGVDVLAHKDGIKYAIQCKCYSSNLGNKSIQEVHSGKSIYHCQVGAVITNQYFTTGAKELAEATGVLLWDRDWIISALTTRATDTFTVRHSPTDQNVIYDKMLPAAVEVILETGQASISIIQNRLNLGYARTARIVEEMEEKGIVGPFRGSNPRTILITRNEWEQMKQYLY